MSTDTSEKASQDYDRAYALGVPQLFAFLRATQAEVFKKLALADADDARDINRLKFLARLSSEIADALPRSAKQGDDALARGTTTPLPQGEGLGIIDLFNNMLSRKGLTKTPIG